ncbi:hypothetical protein BC831DRAFT_415132 [Entophlyctis helioformis]|nr:hypothetical protein BC831DRAFT_415132 [Entophlyctis helioformis]
MSFRINWPEFSPEFIEKAKAQLTVALNHGQSKPANIVDRIVVKELDMGTKPPDLEILEISELVEDRFKGIFKLVYNGDAFIIIQTRVQANPLTVPARDRSLNIRQGMLAAHRPLVVPMEIRISNVKLRGIIVLVVDQERGITLVFKNDPLEKVDVNSTFDNVPNIRRFLQAQIEGQLRNLFQDDMPQMIHKLSREFLAKKEEQKRMGSGGLRDSSSGIIGSDTMMRSGSDMSGFAVGGFDDDGFGQRAQGGWTGGDRARSGSGDLGGNGSGYGNGHQGLPQRSAYAYDPSGRASGSGSYARTSVSVDGYHGGDSGRHVDHRQHHHHHNHNHGNGFNQRHGDDYGQSSYIRSPSRSSHVIPHHQKWSGNEPVATDGYTSDYDSANGYVLYRSLSQSGQPDPAELGLNHLFLHDGSGRTQQQGSGSKPTANPATDGSKSSSSKGKGKAPASKSAALAVDSSHSPWHGWIAASVGRR